MLVGELWRSPSEQTVGEESGIGWTGVEWTGAERRTTQEARAIVREFSAVVRACHTAGVECCRTKKRNYSINSRLCFGPLTGRPLHYKHFRGGL